VEFGEARNLPASDRSVVRASYAAFGQARFRRVRLHVTRGDRRRHARRRHEQEE